MWVQSLGWKDPLEEEMATHSSILAWEILWTEEPGGLQSTGSKESDMLLIQYGSSGLVAKSCPAPATPWTVVRQAPLSIGFPRQEY